MSTNTPLDSPQHKFEPPHENLPSAPLRFLGAGVATVVTHFVMVLTFNICKDSKNGLAESLFYFADAVINRGGIQYLQVFASWLAGVTLIVLALHRRRERALYNEILAWWFAQRAGSDPAAPNINEEMHRIVTEMPEHLKNSRAGRRLERAVRRLDSARSSQEMEQFLNDLREMDAAAADEAHSEVKFLSWLVPTCGFLGTVFGLSKGLMGFGNLVHHAANFNEVQAKIPEVCQELAVSFDTTYLSLVLTMVISWFITQSSSGDGVALSAIDHFCLTAFVYEFPWSSEDNSKGSSPKSAPTSQMLKEINESQQAMGELLLKKGLEPLLLYMQSGLKFDMGPLQEHLKSQSKQIESAAITCQRMDQRVQNLEVILKDGLESNLKALCEMPALMAHMSATNSDLKPAEQAIHAIAANTKQVAQHLSQTNQMVDFKLSHACMAVVKALKETGRDTQFKALIEEFQKLTEHGVQRLENVTDGARQSATQLSEVATRLEHYVREGGVADVAQFNQAVKALSTQTVGFSEASQQFFAAAAQLQSLSRLNEVASDLLQGAKLIREGSVNTLEGAKSFKTSGSELGTVLAKNDASLAESSRVLADASDNIEHLVEIISHTTTAVSNLETAIQGIARRLERPRESDRVTKKE